MSQEPTIRGIIRFVMFGLDMRMDLYFHDKLRYKNIPYEETFRHLS